MRRLISLGLLVLCLIGSSGCALLAALPAFGVAGYVAGREDGREEQARPVAADKPVDRAQAK